MIVAVVAAGTTLLTVGLLLPVLRRAVVDVPNHRSSHDTPIPRGGGLAVMTGVLVALVVSTAMSGVAPAWSVLGPAFGLAALGFIDDLTPLDGLVRLPLQILGMVGLVLWSSGGEGVAGWLIPLLVVLCVGYLNAFNFMDGINGISGINAFVAGAWFAWLGHMDDSRALLTLGLAIAGAGLGFLPWNMPNAKIFLGDVGSYGLGTLIAGGAFLAWVGGTSATASVAPLLLYAVDTGVVLVRRALGGRPLMEAHREHVYQRLVDGGWSHVAASLLTGAVAIVLCVLAHLSDGAPPTVGWLCAAGGVALLLGYVTLPDRDVVRKVVA